MIPLIVKDNPKSISTEAYRTLRTNLQFFTKDRGVKKIVVTSTANDEGKSATISNLALSFSQSGKKVLLIDCDLRKPYIHEYFNVSNRTGFADLVIEKLDYKDVIQKYSDTLHIITSGKVSINPAELLNIDNISPIFDDLKDRYDIILIDSPPVVTFTDTQLLSAVCDGVVVVLSVGESQKKLCRKALQLLENVNANIIGVVIHKSSEDSGVNYKNDYPQYESKSKKRGRRFKRKEVASV